MNINEEKLQIKRTNFWIVICSLVAGLLTYFMLYSDFLTNPDGMFVGGGTDLSISGGWEISLGRWMLPFLDKLRGGVNAPLFNTALSLFLLSIAGVLILSILKVNECKWVKLLIILTIICNPSVMVLLTYFYCSVNYSLAFLLAVCAAWIILRHPNWKGILVGGIAISISLGIYQSYIGVTAALGIESLLLGFFYEFDEQKQLFKKIRNLIFMGLLGVVLYYFVALPVVLKLSNTELASYKGANNLGISSLVLSLPQTILTAYKDFGKFFFTSEIARNPYGIKLFSGIILFVALIVALKIIFFGKRFFMGYRAIMLLGIVLLPVACNLIDLLNPATQINMLTAGGMLTIIPFCIAVISLGTKQMNQTIGKDLTRVLALAMVGVLTWAYVLAVTANMMYLKRQKDQTRAFAIRLCYKLEEDYNYSNNNRQKIYIAGVLSQGNYNYDDYLRNLSDNDDYARNLSDKVDGYIHWGDVWNVVGNSLVGWYQVFAQYTGVFLDMCTVQEALDIRQTKEFKEMPNYPEEGSVKVIQDVIVVKVSDVSNWEE